MARRLLEARAMLLAPSLLDFSNARQITFALLERSRVRAHIAGAEAEMRARSTAHLSSAQKLARALLVDELARYREAGVFPRNLDHEEKTPAFIDDLGTRCAMAHLLEVGGASNLVAKVARERNHAYVPELADEPELLHWLEGAGITVAEAARIQPAYCRTSAASRFCEGGPYTVLEATIRVRQQRDAASSSVQKARLRVNAVYGGDGSDFPASGSEVEVQLDSNEGNVGDIVIIQLPRGAPITQASEVVFAEDGTLSVDLNEWSSSDGKLTLSRAKAIEARTSQSCENILTREDARWTAEQPECDGGPETGCNAAGAGSPSDLAALTLAIVGALLAHRARRKK